MIRIFQRRRPLPSDVTWNGAAPTAPQEVLIGVGRSGLLRWDLHQSAHMLVTGPTGSGKTEALALVTAQAVARKWRVIVCDPLNPSWAPARDSLGKAGEALEFGNDLTSVRDVLELTSREVARRMLSARQRGVQTWGRVQYTDVGPDSERAVLLVLDAAEAFACMEPGASRAEVRRNRVRDAIGGLLDDVLANGAGVGVHVLLAGQDAEKLSSVVSVQHVGAALVLEDAQTPGRGRFRARAGRFTMPVQVPHLARGVGAEAGGPARAVVEAMLLAAVEQGASEEQVRAALEGLLPAGR